VPLRQQCEHLLDLHDLLRGAAEETEQGLAEGLAQQAQAGEGLQAGGQVGVAPPREGIGQDAEIAVGGEVWADGGGDAGREHHGRAPLRGGAVETDLGEAIGPLAAPNAGVRATRSRPGRRPSPPLDRIPAEGLAAVEDLGQHGVRRHRARQRQGLPFGPRIFRHGF
jgi:hypothetical protein